MAHKKGAGSSKNGRESLKDLVLRFWRSKNGCDIILLDNVGYTMLVKMLE